MEKEKLREAQFSFQRSKALQGYRQFVMACVSDPYCSNRVIQAEAALIGHTGAELFEAVDQRGGMLLGTDVAPRSHGPGRLDVSARFADTIVA